MFKSAGLIALVSMAAAAADPIKLGYDGASAQVSATTRHTVWYFPAAGNEHDRQGFVRVINNNGRDGEVTIVATDGGGLRMEPVTLSLEANEATHFNADDLEGGNTAKGLAGSSGPPAMGDWWLELTTDLDIDVLAFVRTRRDGFLTGMNGVVAGQGNRHRIHVFNPGSNWRQVSLLRMVNPSRETTGVRITGVDDAGQPSPQTMRLEIPPWETRVIAADELEDSIGDGDGKWRIDVESDRPIVVMNLMETPAGHVTNLSEAPGDGVEVEEEEEPPPPPAATDVPDAPTVSVTGSRSFRMTWIWDVRPYRTYAFDTAFRVLLIDGGESAWETDCGLWDTTAQHSGPTELFRNFTNFTVNGSAPERGTVVEARYRHRSGGSCGTGSPGKWSGTAQDTF